MLAFEQYRQQHHFVQQSMLDSNVYEPHPDFSMDSYNSFESAHDLACLPYAMYENPALYVDAPQDNFRFEMHRSSSINGSLKPSSNHSAELPPSTLSSVSGRSLPSASSSTVGSPFLANAHSFSHQKPWINSNEGLGLGPAIVGHEGYIHGFVGSDLDSELTFGSNDRISEDFVDPSLIQAPRMSLNPSSSYSEAPIYATIPGPYPVMSPAGSPAPSTQEQPYAQFQPSHFSPPMTYTNFQHQQQPYPGRRSSISSFHSKHSQDSPLSGIGEYDEEGSQKGRCPNQDCGRVFKDLKAHMLTHQSERPEKCPILNCEYNQKGFARKYDKNRHTLTHYKGTMVCGFCPGSGSAAEKSFNRADVFKRHLTSVHGVEQNPPNSRKRSPIGSALRLTSYCEDATGKCSTCSSTFTNAQEFYEHLDDCVLRVVQQEEPSESHNARHLAQVAGDADVNDTLERHMLSTVDETALTGEDEIDDDEDDEEEDDEDLSAIGRSRKVGTRATKPVAGARAVIGSCVSKSGRPGRKGLTYSKGGVAHVGKGRKNRKHYPASWGMSAEKMQMKKRVLCVYDGERRLWKDDMMMHNEFEVRMNLADGKSYVTDLDVETIKRAEAFHHATDEEKGPWVQDESCGGFNLEELMS